MRRHPMRAAVLACLFVLNLTYFPLNLKADVSNASNASTWTRATASGTFARRMVDGRAVCLEASAEQARRIKGRDPNLSRPLPVSDQPGAQASGLKIMLRGPAQLQSFPLARAAFKRAAVRWEAFIQTEAVIVIDVDFGPTLFGEPFDDKVVSITDAQVLRGNCLYPAIRAGLISEAYTSEEISTYDSLPAKAVRTDKGDAAAMTASSATLRALGLINQVADAEAESSSFGPPPAIGFNSKFDFDFDPDDGIDQGKLDFESMASHEIGHVLGFISSVGQQEVNPSVGAEPSIWDLFRVRPDSTGEAIAAAPRIISSGGEQSFYAGDDSLALSTGRPDGTGGDGRQPSHWKDDILTGRYIGVMDPTIGPGEHQAITGNDISVLDAIGYRTSSPDPLLVPLISGRPEAGGLTAPPVNLGVLSRTQYSIAVPRGATRLKIDLSGDQDVDLFVRFGQRILIGGYRPVSDYRSATDANFESVTVTPSSSPPLRQGVYFIAIANFGKGDANFTVTATVTGGTTSSAISRAPAIFNLRANLEGDSLGLDYAATDCNGDLEMAEVSILDEAGRTISPLSRFAIAFGNSTQVESQLTVSGLGAIPQASLASVVLVDRSGNRSAEAIVDFSKAQEGGLTVTKASFDRSSLTLSVRGLADGLELEINGHTVAPPRKIKVKKSGTRLVIKGDAGQLSLKPGLNRVRVKNAFGWSNIFALTI
ncbi:MAG TPA: NF038122 family metalloprotease [Blastocatellia bacterium]|nr:NF038122 family metalloprotease [Blastocatellia bacterium]